MSTSDEETAMLARMNALMALPKTHAVVVTFEGRGPYRVEMPFAKSAENHAEGWRAKIGRDLIDRDTGKTVRVLTVDVVALV